ncbi:hypothetical protein [Amycolatopsis alkalitolerans]|uniref:hypothetical protein n=1 Tax=Amycolatopsis alkalitolerans TaxID=2547244 RepID=UPI00135A2809|nr:hypothetical protein [Amycolatopsis alkalitolerans]
MATAMLVLPPVLMGIATAGVGPLLTFAGVAVRLSQGISAGGGTVRSPRSACRPG